MGLISGLLLALFVVAVIGLSLGERVSTAGPHSALLRCLFPSWRFFEAEEPSLCLLARIVRAPNEVQPFRQVLPAARRGLWSLVFNPHGNLLLACHSLLDGLVDDLAELGPTSLADAERLTSYRLVQNLALYFLTRDESALTTDGAAAVTTDAGVEGRCYQLKLVATGPGQETEELFLSPLYPLS